MLTTCTAPAKEGRTLRLIERGEGFIRIEVKDGIARDEYLIEPLCSDWGIAARFVKAVGKHRAGTEYEVVLGHAGNEEGPDQCNCPGFEKGGTCRHVAALAAVYSLGLLPTQD